MSMTPTTPTFTGVTKQFWDRGEGKFGKAVLIGVGLCLVGAGVFFWGIILPFLIGVVSNTIELAGLVAVLTVLTIQNFLINGVDAVAG